MPSLEILQGCRNKHSRLNIGMASRQQTTNTPQTRESVRSGQNRDIQRNAEQYTQVPNNNSGIEPTESSEGPFDVFFKDNKELVVISAVGLLLVLIL